MGSAPTHARGWREGASEGAFAPVAAVAHVEGDGALPRRESHVAIGVEHPLVLQLHAAGKLAALAQDHEVQEATVSCSRQRICLKRKIARDRTRIKAGCHVTPLRPSSQRFA